MTDPADAEQWKTALTLDSLNVAIFAYTMYLHALYVLYIFICMLYIDTSCIHTYIHTFRHF